MEFLVRLEDKNDKPNGSKKGDLITYKPDGWSWGKMELLHYGIARIDCTEKEAAAMCEPETVVVDGETVVTKFRKKKINVDLIMPPEPIGTWKDKTKPSKVIKVGKI